MILLSRLLNSYFSARLKAASFRRSVYEKAMRKELRETRLGRVILRNLGQAMAANPAYHKEFATWFGEEDYQKHFWESDLGYLWHEGNLTARNPYFEFAIDEIRKRKLESVLDVGCGWGRFCNEVAKLGLAKIKGIDISEDLIAIAKAKFANPAVRFECKDVLQETDKYDLITFFGSTDYISPNEFEKVLGHAISRANKALIVVNSLRGVPMEKAMAIEEAREIRRYDDGFLHPLNHLLKRLQVGSSFDFEIRRFGPDSWMAIINKN